MTRASSLEARDAPQLELLRIGPGVALLASFAPLTPHLAALDGDQGWGLARGVLDTQPGRGLAWCRGAAALTLLHAAFLMLVLAFTPGFGVRWIKWREVMLPRTRSNASYRLNRLSAKRERGPPRLRVTSREPAYRVTRMAVIARRSPGSSSTT